MIVAIVQFDLPAPLERATAEQLFLASSTRYKEVTGLIRKYYLLSLSGNAAGGVYLFDSQAAADSLFTIEWKKYIVAKYGKEPHIQYFQCPVVVDNLEGKIIKG